MRKNHEKGISMSEKKFKKGGTNSGIHIPLTDTERFSGNQLIMQGIFGMPKHY